MTITGKIEPKVALPLKHFDNCLRLAEVKDLIEKKKERIDYFTSLEINNNSPSHFHFRFCDYGKVMSWYFLMVVLYFNSHKEFRGVQ